MDIVFTKHYLGFSVIKSHDGKNAIVAMITNRNVTNLGLVIGLRIVEIQGTNVEGWKHEEILHKISNTMERPLFMTFKKVKVYIDTVKI